MNINVELPEKLTDALFSSARFVVLFGGRGSTKSWSIAKRLLIAGRVSKEKILCGREIQKSIKDSVHAVLRTQIEKMGFADFYEVQNTSIIGKNGTEFIFAGL